MARRRVFYGWIIVGAGIVVTCMGLGAMSSPDVLYLFTNATSAFYALALVFGLSYGGVMPLYAILVREFYVGSTAIGIGAIAIALTFRPPRGLPAALPSLTAAG